MSVLAPAQVRLRRIAGVSVTLALLTIGAALALSVMSLTDTPNPLTASLVMATAFLIGVQGIRTDCGWNAAMRCAGPTSVDAPTLVAHTGGVILGSLATAVAVWGLGQFVSIPAMVVAGACLLLGTLRLFRPNTLAPWGWKVRRQWESWGTVPYMLVFGFCIGLGFLTTMASPVFLALMLYGTSSSLAVVCMTFAWFAVGRLVTTWVVAIGDSRTGADVTRSADRVQRRTRYVGILEAAAAVVAGASMLVA